MEELKIIFLFISCIVFCNLVSASYDYSNNELVIPIQKGWNLVPITSINSEKENSLIRYSDFSYGYIFDLDDNKYIKVINKGKLLSDDFNLGSWAQGDYIERTAFFVYSKKEGEFRTEFKGLYGDNFKLRNYNLYKGWNFLYITPYMKGVTYDDFKGNCSIQKICNYNNRKWDCRTSFIPEEVIADADSDVGQGFVIKVSGDCKLGGIFPERIGDYNLISMDDAHDNGCQMIEETEYGRTYNLSGEICFNSSRVEYKESNSNKGVFVSLTKIWKGKDIYKLLFYKTAKPVNVGAYNLLTLENWEYIWFTSKKYDLILTQEFVEEKSLDGTSTSYHYQNASIDNPVIKYFVNKYPPI